MKKQLKKLYKLALKKNDIDAAIRIADLQLRLKLTQKVK